MSACSFVLHLLSLWCLLIATLTDVAIGYVDGQRSGVQYYNCLKNVKVQNATATSVTLSWNFRCDDGETYDNVRYKVTTTHESWLACKNNVRDKRRGHNEVDNKNQITINHLHPYSDYTFEVKAIPSRRNDKAKRRRLRPDEEEIQVSTLEGLPGISPRESSVGPSINDDKITFFWRSPLNTNCRHFNGKIDGYEYVLKGSDKWSRDDEFKGDSTETRKIFEGLQPMSEYSLKVFVRNSMGYINEDFPLELSATTRKSDRIENPPQNFKAVMRKESLLLSWQPPYPPTSTIETYIIQWKHEDDNNSGWNNWSNEIEVFPKTDSCLSLGIQTVNPELMCHKIDNFTRAITSNNDDKNFGTDAETNSNSQIAFGSLDITRNYVFRISAIAPNQKLDIIWSKRVIVTSDTGEEPREVRETGWIAIAVIVSLVAIFLLILIVICVRHRCNQPILRNGQHQHKPDYKPVSTYESQYNGVNQPPSLRTQNSILSEFSDVNNPSSMISNVSWNRQQGPSVEFRKSLPPPQRPQRNGRGTNNSFNVGSNSLPRNSDMSSSKPKTKDYSQFMLPSPQAQSPPSILGTPLPPVPVEEPIYDELQLDNLPKEEDKSSSAIPKRNSYGPTNTPNEAHKYSNTNKKPPRKKSEGFESEDDFLEPVEPSPSKVKDGNESDDNDYLAPTSNTVRPNTINNLFRKSCSDIDNDNNGDEYLKPTFNQFDRIDSRDLSPPHERPPPIPMQSYTPLPGNERIIPIKIEK